MPSLLENKLLLQYLAGAGQDLLAGQPIGQNVNAVTMQNISAQNYAKLLGQLLRGGGKMTVDKENVNIKAPASAFGGEGIEAGGAEGLATKVPQAAGGSGIDWSKPENYMKLSEILRSNIINPSSSPLGVSGADLAGLTPEMISQALQLKLGYEKFGQEKITDLVDMAYKGTLMDLYEEKTRGARIENIAALMEQLNPSTPEVPGLGRLTWDRYKALPTDVRSYGYYVWDAKRRGDEPLSYGEWKAGLDEPTIKQYYDLAKEDPEFREFLMEYQERGATKIGTFEREVEKGKGRGIATVTSPEFPSELRETVLKEDRREIENRASMLQESRGLDYETAHETAIRIRVLERMDRAIKDAYAAIDKTAVRRSDGWYVDGELVRRNPYAR